MFHNLSYVIFACRGGFRDELRFAIATNATVPVGPSQTSG